MSTAICFASRAQRRERRQKLSGPSAQSTVGSRVDCAAALASAMLRSAGMPTPASASAIVGSAWACAAPGGIAASNTIAVSAGSSDITVAARARPSGPSSSASNRRTSTSGRHGSAARSIGGTLGPISGIANNTFFYIAMQRFSLSLASIAMSHLTPRGYESRLTRRITRICPNL